MTFPWPRVWLTLGALLPYWRFLSLNVIYVTDDYFASDIFNGELAGRALLGRMLGAGEWPVWTSELCTGLPLAGSPSDPLGLIAFSQLPPAPALDLYVIALILIAAHGSYGLARRFGVDTTSALLAGLAFAGSGVIAVQLKHLAIIATVAWLPFGLSAIDRVLDPEAQPARRSLWAAGFALIFAQQVLAGFPQSAYICALVYGAFSLFRAAERYQLFPQRGLMPLVTLAAAVTIGVAAGAVILLPLSQLAAVSGRAEMSDWTWATYPAYWPPALLQFLFPYIHGDISNNTYLGSSLFWEDYGYVGLLTFILAVYGAIREWKAAGVKFLVVMTALAMLFVLGRSTPVYYAAYHLIPGLGAFRFPTRFLIVVELGLAVLAAIGLTRARREIGARQSGRIATLMPAAICLLTVADLSFHQSRQNPVVPAAAWLAEPPSVAAIRADAPHPRTFTPQHRQVHRAAFGRAEGWADVTPYFELRGLLEPNVGAGYWSVASADCYAGISARWSTDVWGDHNREDSLVSRLAKVDFASRRLLLQPAFSNVMRTFGVTHVLSPYPQEGASLTLIREDPGALVYRVEGAARARFVPSATVVATDTNAAARLLDLQFDPDREVLLHDVVDPVPAATLGEGGSGTARITGEGATWIDVTVDAPAAGYLLLADTYYPGWSATIDGAAASILRANISSRVVAVGAGQHVVHMTYDPPGFAAGWRISAAALAVLIVWLAASFYAVRNLSKPIAP